jgi:integrase
MASLIKSPDSKFWIACFRDSSSKQHRRSTRETNKKRAQAVAEEFESAAQSSRPVSRITESFREFVAKHHRQNLPIATVRDYFESWLTARAAETAVATVRKYRNTVDKFLTFLGPDSDTALENVTREHVTAFRNARLKQSAALTANTDLKILRMIFRSARQEDYIVKDPAEAVKTVRSRDTVGRRPFSLDELRAVLAVADPEWGSLIKCGLYTGQRLGDLALLTWSQVDFERDEIRLIMRKTGKRMLLPIAPPLKEHLLSIAGDDSRAPLHPHAYAIVARQFERVGTLSNQFADILIAAGLRSHVPHRSRGIGREGKRAGSELSFHSLRHSAVSLLKDAGVPDAVVMALVGHESAAMSHHYTHVGKEALNKAAGTLPQI